MKKILLLKLAAIVGLLFMRMTAFAAPPAPAAPADKLANRLLFNIGVSYENSDNIHQTPQNPISDDIVHGLFSSEYSKLSPSLTANFSLNIDYASYRKHSFPDRAFATSLLNLTSTLSKNRLFWDINNKFDHVRESYTAADVPSNQINTNYFTSGPRVSFFKNNKQSWDAGIKYEKFNTQKADSDFSGYLFNSTYSRNISRTLSLSLSASYNDRKYDYSVTSIDYTKRDLVFGLTKQARLSSITMQVGKTKVSTQNYNKNNQNIFRLNYKYSGKTQMEISYRRELGDFSTQFANATATGGALPGVSNNIFLVKEGMFSAAKVFNTATIKLSYIYFSSDYDNNLLDERRETSRATLLQRMPYGMGFKLEGMYVDDEFYGQNRDDIERSLVASLTRKFVGRYDLSFHVRYLDRSSSDSNFSFQERRVGLTGHYYF